MDGSETHPCPFCGATQLIMMEDHGSHYQLCLECRACGPTADSAEEASEEWEIRFEDLDAGFRARRVILLS